MAQVGYPRLYSVYGVPDSRWDLQACFPQSIAGVQAARAANPNIIVMMTHSSTATFPFSAATYGSPWLTFTGATDNITDGAAANAGVVRGFNAFWDQYYKPDGTIARHVGGTSGTPIWNYANIAHSIGTEKTWLAHGRFILYRVKQNRLYRDSWDGVRFDNWMSISMGNYGGQSFDSDRNGVQDPTNSVRGWHGDGLNAWGKYLRDSLPGMIVGGNVIYKFSPHSQPVWVATHTDHDGWHKYANFTEIEDGNLFLYSHSGAQLVINICSSTDTTIEPTSGSSLLGWLNYPDPYGQERYIAFFFQLRDDSGNTLAKPSNFNSPSVYKQETYYKPARKGLALATIAGAYYFPCFEQEFESKLYYDDEMLGGSGIAQRNWMGQPTAAATTPVSGVFMREFQSGLAIVNVTSSNQTVTLPGGANNWRKIAGTASHNDGATITGTTFTIPAHDGRLLVRLGSSPTLPPINTVAPSISGTEELGGVLTPSAGSWLNTPTTYEYTFARYSSDGLTRLAQLQTETIAAAASPSTYTIVAGDVGFTIRLEITATNSDGSADAISVATGIIGAAEASTRLDTPPSSIFDFTIASISTPASIFPPSLISGFDIFQDQVVTGSSLTLTSASATTLGLTPEVGEEL